MNYKKLFHDEAAFKRETLEERMQDYGFKNMGRMEVRDMMIEKYGDASLIPAKILKGKNPQRVFWAVVTLNNMDEIKASKEEFAGR